MISRGAQIKSVVFIHIGLGLIQTGKYLLRKEQDVLITSRNTEDIILQDNIECFSKKAV